MKTYPLIFVALLASFASYSQPTPLPSPGLIPPRPMTVSPQQAPVAVPAKEPVNYLIRIEWKEPKGDAKTLEVLTTTGQVQYDGLQKNPVKINNNDVPATLKLTATLTAISDEKGRLQLFLGRTVPYVTGSYGNGPSVSSSYSQMSVGLDSTFIVTFGKPVVIQSDDNGDISVLVKRMTE